MMGPFDVWTTARSGESAGAAGGGGAAASSDFLGEHPVRNTPAEAANAARPNSLRFRLLELLSVDVPDAQVPHPLEWQVPHPLADLLSMTLNVSFMLLSPLPGGSYARFKMLDSAHTLACPGNLRRHGGRDYCQN